MVDIKLVIGNPKTGKSFQQEIKDDVAKQFLGKKIGDKIKGEVIDYTGYEFELTGGSDKSGFPMRRDVEGSAKKKILAVEGTGLKRKTSKTKKGKMRFKGIKIRKTVAGNTVGQETSQINLKVIKEGKEKIAQLEPVKEEPKAEVKEEAKTEAKKEKAEVKEETKTEAKEEKAEVKQTKTEAKEEKAEVKEEKEATNAEKKEN